MDNYVACYDEDHTIQRLYVHWDLHTICSNKCSYCYARKEYEGHWSKLANPKVVDSVLEALDRAELPIFLGLQGGEPTLTPDYFSLLKRIHRIISKNPLSRCYITTNAIKSPEWWIKHPVYKQFYMLWSYHPEYQTEESSKKFLESVDIMYNKGFKTKVNLMLVNDSNLWPMIENVRNSLFEKYGTKIEIHPHYLYPDGNMHEIYPYSEEFWTFWKHLELSTVAQFCFEDKGGILHHHNEYTMFKNGLARFNGWACWNNNYEIHMDGEVVRFCANEKSNLTTDLDFFKRIKEITPMICKFNGCFCDGLSKIRKTKEIPCNLIS